MRDQVRVATDRRGEVAVGGAGEPGVAEVAVAVDGGLERAEHKRCIRGVAVPAALGLAADQAARLRRQLGRLRRGDALRIGQRRRRQVERGELLEQDRDPARVRVLVDAVERRRPATLAELGDALVGEDHQLLDQPVGLGLLDRVGADDVAVGVEAELGLGGRDLECRRRGGARAARPPPAGRARAAPRSPREASRARRRTRRAGRRRDDGRSGCGCGRSSRSASPRPWPSAISAVTASRSTSGARLQAPAESAAGSIGSTAPGT